jgi:hypothetical protein
VIDGDAKLRFVQGLRIIAACLLPLPLLLDVVVWDMVNMNYHRDSYDRTAYWLLNGSILGVAFGISAIVARFRWQSLRVGLGVAVLVPLLTISACSWLL